MAPPRLKLARCVARMAPPRAKLARCWGQNGAKVVNMIDPTLTNLLMHLGVDVWTIFGRLSGPKLRAKLAPKADQKSMLTSKG